MLLTVCRSLSKRARWSPTTSRSSRWRRAEWPVSRHWHDGCVRGAARAASGRAGRFTRGDTLGAAVDRSRGLAASELKSEKKTNLAVHGRTGQVCPVCGDTVREVSFADSSLQYCPTCQTGGKPLADRRMSKLLK